MPDIHDEVSPGARVVPRLLEGRRETAHLDFIRCNLIDDPIIARLFFPSLQLTHANLACRIRTYGEIVAGGDAVPCQGGRRRGRPAARKTYPKGRGHPQLGTVTPRPRIGRKSIPVWQVT